MKPESKVLEYKLNTGSRTYLKTVSAMANYQNGQIVFGVADDLTVAGIENPDQEALRIENQINDQISPRPDFDIDIDEENKIIVLNVYRGRNTPYYFNGKAYVRSGTSTVPVDSYQLKNLILRGSNLEFCNLPSDEQNLSFEYLKGLWEKRLSSEFSKDQLATLQIWNSEDGYTNTGLLLSSQNSFPGISMVQFNQNDINQILCRKNIENKSVLEIFEDGLNQLTELLSYEQITPTFRELRFRVPPEALREVLLNALAYRDWMIREPVRIQIFGDRLTVMSPGGLPDGITEEEYLFSSRSIPRNTWLSMLMLRLHIMEGLGTGISRVLESYKETGHAPEFRIYQNSIQVTLPFTDREPKITRDEKAVLNALKKMEDASRKELDEVTGFSQTKTSRILAGLAERGMVRKTGTGRAVRYSLPTDEQRVLDSLYSYHL